MNRAKYVVIKGYGYPDTIFIFNGWFEHAKYCNLFSVKKEDILSAGFVNLETKECFGRSNSLNIDSREEDSKLVRILFQRKEK